MRTAEERRGMLEQLLERVRKNRTELEQARVAGPAMDQPATIPEPTRDIELPIPTEPPPRPAPGVGTPKIELKPKPVTPTTLQPEPIKPVPPKPKPVVVPSPAQQAPVPEPEVVTEKAETKASGPVATVDGAQRRDWSLDAVLKRAWTFGTTGRK